MYIDESSEQPLDANALGKVPGQDLNGTDKCNQEEIDEARTEFETESYEEIRNSKKRNTKLPEHLKDYILYNAEEVHSTNLQQENRIPVTVKEALTSPEADMWKRAMDEEIGNLKRSQTWELVTKPPKTKLITSKWIFCKKKNETGNGVKFKARLVAKGYMQVPGIDFQETFSPVIKLKSIRLLLAIAVEKDLEVHQMDITSAYLNGVLEEDIYMHQPEGCLEEGKEHLVCHLKRSLYALSQCVCTMCVTIMYL